MGRDMGRKQPHRDPLAIEYGNYSQQPNKEDETIGFGRLSRS